MKFNKIFSGRALYAEKDRIWVAKGMSFYAIDYEGNKLTKTYTIGNFAERLVGGYRLSRQLLRIGIHHFLLLKNGNYLLTAKRKTYIIDKDGKVKNIFKGYNGNKPSHQGICITPDGTIFFGEYTVNLDHKNETRLYRSKDNGLTFECVLTFPSNDIRHIHFIKWDIYDSCLWLGTGDSNTECKLMCSVDNGDTWDLIGEGSQLWRAIGICCTVEYLYWGTDAGSVPDKNYIVRMNKKTRKIEKLEEVEGPCHGCATLSDGTVLISTGVEGGENEKDRYARLKVIKNNRVSDMLRNKKDIFPFIVQYGVMRFPLGMENTNKIIFTEYALEKGGEVVLIANEY